MLRVFGGALEYVPAVMVKWLVAQMMKSSAGMCGRWSRSMASHIKPVVTLATNESVNGLFTERNLPSATFGRSLSFLNALQFLWPSERQGEEEKTTFLSLSCLLLCSSVLFPSRECEQKINYLNAVQNDHRKWFRPGNSSLIMAVYKAQNGIGHLTSHAFLCTPAFTSLVLLWSQIICECIVLMYD